MDKRRTLSMLGLCRKAGKLELGFDAVRDAIFKGQAYLVLLTEDLSERTARRVEESAVEMEIPVRTCAFGMDDVGRMTGRASGVLAVLDDNLAGAVLNAIGLEEEMD